MRFALYELFQADALWERLPIPSEPSRELADAILEEGGRIAAEVLSPLLRSGDEEGVRWEDGNVYTPAGFREAYRTFAEGGWVGLGGNPEYGGQGIPKMLSAMVEEMVASAGGAFGLYAILTSGAALLLDAHGREEQKNRFLPPLYEGRWAGVMCLTEAHAGTDLGMLRTRAEPQSGGTYRLTGTKIFITGGEQDLTENIIHLVLARLPDAPAGTRGISLFIVPKFLVNEDGSLGERNAVHCGSIEHKMGLHGSSTCVINYDGAQGYLVGEPGRGLNYMFTMMNYERVSVGLQGLGCAERSWQGAARYARERLQGRALRGPVNPDGPADPILVHGDVRRMLLTQRAYIEGGRAFAAFVNMQLDLAKYGEGAEREQGAALVALLTPIAKAFLTDLGLEACVLGQQVLGGHGYIREWGMEQLVRDVRISQIYEGTNGIQALDLLGRKVVADQGQTALALFGKIREWAASVTDQPGAIEFVGPVVVAVDRLHSTTLWLLNHVTEDPDLINSSAVDYLQLFGNVMFGWLWARAALVALPQAESDAFYAAKLETARFFMARCLPRVQALAAMVETPSATVMAISDQAFDV
jgi:alkylation response protein AidB-like acyl-CoA dehydrogenase